MLVLTDFVIGGTIPYNVDNQHPDQLLLDADFDVSAVVPIPGPTHTEFEMNMQLEG